MAPSSGKPFSRTMAAVISFWSGSTMRSPITVPRSAANADSTCSALASSLRLPLSVLPSMAMCRALPSPSANLPSAAASELVLDRPMAAREFEQTRRPGLGGGEAGDNIGDLGADLVADLARALDACNLGGAGPVEMRNHLGADLD